MDDDEAHTIQTLKVYRDLMSDLIQNHSGRVVDNPGDNLLSEFSSAVNAVDCAVEIQNRLKKENAKFVEEKRLQFRIGVNIGDVVHDSDRIYGSGVNVTARIEGIADPGGICISRNTYDQVKDKLDLGFEYLGEHEVKNIKEPVRVYKVLMDAEPSKPLVEEKLELPDKPSIAVLPFTNMSGDPGQEYFSDGLTEQIINGLCKVSNLFVIARNSSFAYKGKSVSVKQIAKELGVRYILEGSVQRAGNHVRITAQLIDATTDYHMWSENYDRDLEDIFELQDEITMKLISVMDVQLIYGEQARLWEGIVTKNIRAYEMCMKSFNFYHRFTKHDVLQARECAKEAISLDDEYPLAHVVLGLTHWVDLFASWSEDPIESYQQMELCANKALSLTKSLDMTYVLLGLIQLIQRNHDKAINYEEIAVKLNPNGAAALVSLAFVLVWSGRSKEAISMAHRALRLNPIPQGGYYVTLGLAYRNAGEYEKALKVYESIIKENSESIIGYLGIAASYSLLGHYEEANNAIKEALRIEPTYSIDRCVAVSPFKNKADLDVLVEANRKAGLPEHSPE